MHDNIIELEFRANHRTYFADVKVYIETEAVPEGFNYASDSIVNKLVKHVEKAMVIGVTDDEGKAVELEDLGNLIADTIEHDIEAGLHDGLVFGEGEAVED